MLPNKIAKVSTTKWRSGDITVKVIVLRRLSAADVNDPTIHTSACHCANTGEPVLMPLNSESRLPTFYLCRRNCLHICYCCVTFSVTNCRHVSRVFAKMHFPYLRNGLTGEAITSRLPAESSPYRYINSFELRVCILQTSSTICYLCVPVFVSKQLVTRHVSSSERRIVGEPNHHTLAY